MSVFVGIIGVSGAVVDHILEFKNFCAFCLGEVSWFCRHYCGFASKMGFQRCLCGFVNMKN